MACPFLLFLHWTSPLMWVIPPLRNFRLKTLPEMDFVLTSPLISVSDAPLPLSCHTAGTSEIISREGRFAAFSISELSPLNLGSQWKIPRTAIRPPASSAIKRILPDQVATTVPQPAGGAIVHSSLLPSNVPQI